MLDRIGGEVARATSLVRYAPRSRFSPHVHGGGEEFLVLEGVFSDETGDFPAGTYVRNPVDSGHAPHSDPGCVIFVKLHQFDPTDRRQIAIHCDETNPEPGGESPHRQVLHQHSSELVEWLRFAPGGVLPREDLPGGEEIFVVAGELESDGLRHGPGTWIRNPPGRRAALTCPPAARTAARLYRKVGHLTDERLQPWR